MALYRMYLEGWRLYPLQSALRGAVGGFLALCINFVLPTVKVQLPFAIPFRPNMSAGPGEVSFTPPPDWILFGGVILTVALVAWLAYLNHKHVLPSLRSS